MFVIRPFTYPPLPTSIRIDSCLLNTFCWTDFAETESHSNPLNLIKCLLMRIPNEPINERATHRSSALVDSLSNIAFHPEVLGWKTNTPTDAIIAPPFKVKSLGMVEGVDTSSALARKTRI